MCYNETISPTYCKSELSSFTKGVAKPQTDMGRFNHRTLDHSTNNQQRNYNSNGYGSLDRVTSKTKAVKKQALNQSSFDFARYSF